MKGKRQLTEGQTDGFDGRKEEYHEEIRHSDMLGIRQLGDCGLISEGEETFDEVKEEEQGEEDHCHRAIPMQRHSEGQRRSL